MKRFTDSDKWQDPWFRKLHPDAKLLWFFLCDKCDHAGVWEIDEDSFQFHSGTTCRIDSLWDAFGDRVQTLGENKVYLPKFILYQQGGLLSEAKAPHRGILKLMEKHGLEIDENGITEPRVKLSLGKAKGKANLSLSKAKPNLNQGLTKALVTGNGKGKGKGKNKEKGGMGEKTIPEALDDPAFHEAWEAYLEHRRQNRWATHKKNTLANMFEDFETWGLDETIKALNESIRQGWRGVFPPKSDKPNRMEPDRDYDNALKIKK